jgi:hypothetical protein
VPDLLKHGIAASHTSRAIPEVLVGLSEVSALQFTVYKRTGVPRQESMSSKTQLKTEA